MLKSIQKHRRGQDMSKRVNMPKCKEKLAEKSAERRKKKTEKRKRGQNCTLPGKNYQG